MAPFFNGNVNTNSPSEVSPNRYNSLKLQDSEPNLGLPDENNFMLVSDTNGVRSWVPSTAVIGVFIERSIIDNKGDIIVGVSADNPAILPVGDNGQLLVADSSSPTGMKWFTPLPPILQTIITEKGDFIVGQGPESPATLSVGGDGDILVADSSQTFGVKWEPDSSVHSTPSLVPGSSSISNIVSLTQATYDSILSPDPSTLYVIVG
jgi:hypothetical protein